VFEGLAGLRLNRLGLTAISWREMKQGVAFDAGLGGYFSGLGGGQVVFGCGKVVIARPESAFNEQVVSLVDQFDDGFPIFRIPCRISDIANFVTG